MTQFSQKSLSTWRVVHIIPASLLSWTSEKIILLKVIGGILSSAKPAPLIRTNWTCHVIAPVYFFTSDRALRTYLHSFSLCPIIIVLFIHILTLLWEKEEFGVVFPVAFRADLPITFFTYNWIPICFLYIYICITCIIGTPFQLRAHINLILLPEFEKPLFNLLWQINLQFLRSKFRFAVFLHAPRLQIL